ncbi:MAG: glycosyltransferase family 4 protein [Deltaproteobacteria bacterium]|nr:glycosyltransferase family 4 protein [Deltaproteobacteria bacterium]
MKKKKIGIVSEYFYPHLGGVTEHVYYYSRELIRRGFEVVLLTGYEGKKIEVELPPSLRIIPIGKTIPIYSNHSFAKVTVGWNLGGKIKKILEEEKFDLLHIHSPMMPILPLLFEKYTNTLTIGTIHTYFDSFGALFFYRLFRKGVQAYLNKLDGFIAVAPCCLESLDLFFHYSRDKLEIIPNGVDTHWSETHSGRIDKYADGTPNILFLGRLDPRNGLDLLLDAFPQVLKKVPKARLIVIGDGPLRSFYEKKASPFLGENVFFEGQINDTRPEYFATSDVFCYPATKSAFSVTVLEAMACGKPVVATENKGFCDMMQNGVNGILVEQGRADKLAEALVQVLQDKNLAKKLSDNGREMIRNYSWETITDRVLAFYDKISLQKRGVPFIER